MPWEAPDAPTNSNPSRPAPEPPRGLSPIVRMILPALDDPDFGYEAGVHLGDGSLSKYRYVISGNRQNETQYYRDVLAPLISRLYGISPTICFENNSVYLRIYNKELVLFKNSLGFPIGRKLHLSFPQFAETNMAMTANVISGLYDTDGSVKVRHNKSGSYPRISLGQKHEELVSQTRAFLSLFGITSTMYRNDYFDPRNGLTETRWFLDINGFTNFNLFLDSIGTRSPYVRKRIEAIDAIR